LIVLQNPIVVKKEYLLKRVLKLLIISN
jgi:hypothetical protein